jgi:hypothetical protein
MVTDQAKGAMSVTLSRDLPREWPLRQALQAAQAVLDGKLSVIEGSRALADYMHDIVPNWSSDPDFVVFGVVASETDDLPTGESRRYWSSRALEEFDAKTNRISSAAEGDVRAACANVIARFRDSATYA